MKIYHRFSQSRFLSSTSFFVLLLLLGALHLTFSTEKSGQPTIWFGPMPPGPLVAGPEFHGGSADFMKLFDPRASWAKAAQRVKVFHFYSNWVQGIGEEELKRAVNELNRRGITIAVEGEGLEKPGNCGDNVEGFGILETEMEVLRRLKKVGGEVKYVALDHSFDGGSLYDGPTACHWPVEKTAQGVANYVRHARQIFPHVLVGDWIGVTYSVQKYKELFDAYRRIAGEPLAFILADSDSGQLGWPEAVKQFEDFAHREGMEFGVAYNEGEAESDEAWIKGAEERMNVYEAQTGGRPNHVVFMSWTDRPHHALPEDDPTTFTSLINRYFRRRTRLNLAVDAPGNILGRLMDDQSQPIPTAPIEFSVKPLEGPGAFFEYKLSGVVPAGTKKVMVGFRVNMGCGECAGKSDFSLYGVRYLENKEKTNRVPYGDFSKGLDHWGVVGDAHLEASDRGSGQRLHVRATPKQTALLNSELFSVSAGAPYTVVFSAHVSPDTRNSSYFVVSFLNRDGTKGIGEQRIPIDPIVVSGHAIGDNMGTFHINLKEIPRYRSVLEVKYPGNDTHWPAFAEKVIRP